MIDPAKLAEWEAIRAIGDRAPSRVIEEPGDYVIESERLGEWRICRVEPSDNPYYPWVATDRGGYRQEFDSGGFNETPDDDKRVICKCIPVPPFRYDALIAEVRRLQAENAELRRET